MEDDRFGKTKKKGGEGNSTNMDLRESVNKMFQRKVSRMVFHFAIGLLSKATAGRDPPQEQVMKTTELHKGQCAHLYQMLTFSDNFFCTRNHIYCNTF